VTTALVVAAALWSAIGVAFGVWALGVLDLEEWRHVGSLGWRAPLYLVGLLLVLVVTAVVWPVLALRAWRAER
jgi:hypothetical protein